MAGFPLPPGVDPNQRVAPGDPAYGLHAFGAAWHDLWNFFTNISREIFANFTAVQGLADRN